MLCFVNLSPSNNHHAKPKFTMVVKCPKFFVKGTVVIAMEQILPKEIVTVINYWYPKFYIFNNSKGSLKNSAVSCKQ